MTFREEQIGPCRLILGDCLEVLPGLARVDAVVTDPPWMARASKITRRAGGVAKVVNPSKGIGYGSIGEFSTAALETAFGLVNHDMLVICGFKELGRVIAVLEPIRGVFIWHKPNGGISVAYPCPLDTAYIVWGAKTSKITGYQHWRSGVMSHSVPTAGCISNGERVLEEENGKAAHPCQGPLSLYRQLLTPIRGSVLDPYLGSGTTGVACVELERQFIGIELEPKYFDIACRRIERAWRLKCSELPFDPPPVETQPELFGETA
jgi:site-specific DNA-methyltransferase (adenine-specific)